MTDYQQAAITAYYEYVNAQGYPNELPSWSDLPQDTKEKIIAVLKSADEMAELIFSQPQGGPQ